ncbi:Adenylyltransferase and sulfurtransferase uba4 [Taphrina deformans PYCC 5710]|uniref:Adenylyltransferase and sulfurtransferase uba4 n=1 Tax=Taphrina deformans (strain PYCC 5710 / ATCC 11124 / CBS 356.35 / IMI 108563 / JCM 9778 / NBRC 8474) TaxID=1097556 RepID=R4XFB6_TAPDE|nr:Adenylyltransferase and sulfurtransferase uba4 [Taphrina deformans PYCC 5710]|eukprot:CCG83136.1 Adenylyltransferase and sulfurtransferase uba4 [Taphrina deformans PYCC 5710]
MAAALNIDLDLEEYKRYGRQMILPNIGKIGQLRLKSCSVLVVGIGGLGCPAVAYLAGAGVGRIGLMDEDRVEVSNCHRQILHHSSSAGIYKVDSAAVYIKALNPNIRVTTYRQRLSAANARLILQEYDVVLDCTDNQISRYLVSDACVLLGKPFVTGSALQTEGQLAVLNYRGGPCYRCLFPVASPVETVQSCGEAGILGPVVGVIGVLQALETIKLIIHGQGISEASEERSSTYMPTLTLFSAMDAVPWRTIKLRKKKNDCISCGQNASITFVNLGIGDYERQTTRNISSGHAPIALTEDKRICAVQLQGFKGTIIDVRNPTEFAIACLPGSKNVPLPDLETYEVYENVPILVVCRHGIDSQQAVRKLTCRFPTIDIKDLRGGLQAYSQVDPFFPIY